MSLRCLVLLALCAACDRCEQANFVGAGVPRLVYTGRFEPLVDGSVRFAWPGSRIEARFRGSSLRMRLTDVPVEDETRETDWFAVRIDGNRARALHALEGFHLYTLAQGLGPGVHRVEIVKRTEGEVGTATFHGFELDVGHDLAAPERRPPHHLELVGDSITAGYGNEGKSGDCHWSAAAENVDLSYGAVAARELDASYTAIAWSGKGVLRNYDPRELETMPVLYDRVIPTEPASAPAPVGPSALAVVVNLGTNDLFPGIPDERAFSRAYLDLLAKLRARHPKALLVLALGPMLADDFPHKGSRTIMRRWLTAIRDQRVAGGDPMVELIELWIDPAEGVGCDFHPNAKTHARLGHELAAAIRARL